MCVESQSASKIENYAWYIFLCSTNTAYVLGLPRVAFAYWLLVFIVCYVIAIAYFAFLTCIVRRFGVVFL